jgi:hypothetical protein
VNYMLHLCIMCKKIKEKHIKIDQCLTLNIVTSKEECLRLWFDLSEGKGLACCKHWICFLLCNV